MTSSNPRPSLQTREAGMTVALQGFLFHQASFGHASTQCLASESVMSPACCMCHVPIIQIFWNWS